MKCLGLIGAGSIAHTIVSSLCEQLVTPFETLSVLVPAIALEEGQRRLAGLERLAQRIVFRTELSRFLEDRPDLVVECAGHEAVREHCPQVLASGRDLILASVGALSDDGLRADLEGAARAGKSHLILTPGAMGAIDLLGAARLSGLQGVTYTGRKPPRAWSGTAAEELINLAAVAEPTVFFTGTARQAAHDFPQNANVAATLALAGLGFDATMVKLVADPTVQRNVHEVDVESACVSFSIKIQGVPSPINPKSSLTAGFSLARLILARTTEVVV